MERQKCENMTYLKSITAYILVLQVTVFISFPVAQGQNTADFRSRVYKSYVEGKMNDWKSVLADMEQVYKQVGSDEILYELLMAQYGYIGFCLKEEKKKEASVLLDKARYNLELLQRKDPGNAEYLALEGAFLGYEMGLHKLKAMVLGPKARNKIDEAVEKDPGHVRTLIEKANQLYFSPKILGGDIGKAIEYYKKAINKIESQPRSLKQNWIYLNTLLVLAQAYEKTGNMTYACAIYEKIMDYDPDIKWVRNNLYSGCRGKTGPGR
jgi:tetratricopeptide (TPR) repeat protein